MGNNTSQINNDINIVGFDDMKYSIDKNYNIITTLSNKNTTNLIKNTINPNEEELCINDMIDNNRFNENIIIYGKNNCDNKIYLKYKDLINFGFNNVYVYAGGMFEWMLLQDIYGADDFPTTIHELDILKFKPIPIINNSRLLT